MCGPGCVAVNETDGDDLDLCFANVSTCQIKTLINMLIQNRKDKQQMSEIYDADAYRECDRLRDLERRRSRDLDRDRFFLERLRDLERRDFLRSRERERFERLCERLRE